MVYECWWWWWWSGRKEEGRKDRWGGVGIGIGKGGERKEGGREKTNRGVEVDSQSVVEPGASEMPIMPSKRNHGKHMMSLGFEDTIGIG